MRGDRLWPQVELLEARDLAAVGFARGFIWPRWQFAVNVVPIWAPRPFVAPPTFPAVNVVPAWAPQPYVVPNWGFWARGF